jgi:hypothetical protein
MEKEFVTYDQALALKELGFDEPCWCYFVNDVFFDSMFPKDYDYFEHMNKKMEYTLAPLKSQVFKWFRDKYNLKSCIMFRTSMEDDKEYYDWLIKGQEVVYRHFKTYEEAESACIDKLIEILKKK